MSNNTSNDKEKGEYYDIDDEYDKVTTLEEKPKIDRRSVGRLVSDVNRLPDVSHQGRFVSFGDVMLSLERDHKFSPLPSQNEEVPELNQLQEDVLSFYSYFDNLPLYFSKLHDTCSKEMDLLHRYIADMERKGEVSEVGYKSVSYRYAACVGMYTLPKYSKQHKELEHCLKKNDGYQNTLMCGDPIRKAVDRVDLLLSVLAKNEKELMKKAYWAKHKCGVDYQKFLMLDEYVRPRMESFERDEQHLIKEGKQQEVNESLRLQFENTQSHRDEFKRRADNCISKIYCMDELNQMKGKECTFQAPLDVKDFRKENPKCRGLRKRLMKCLTDHTAFTANVVARMRVQPEELPHLPKDSDFSSDYIPYSFNEDEYSSSKQ